MHLRSGNEFYTSDDTFLGLRSGNFYLRPQEETPAPETFDNWKTRVNNLVFQELHTHCDDLPDFPYQDCFSENMEPIQVLNQIRSRLYRTTEDVEMTSDDNEPSTQEEFLIGFINRRFGIS